MGKRQKAVFPGHPKVVTRMIFMVVRVDDEGGAEDITEFQEFFPPVNETRVDEQAIDEKGMNPKKTEARKPADHANRIHGTPWHAMHRNPIHVLLVLMTTPWMMKLINSFVCFDPNGCSGLFLPYVRPLNSKKMQ
jgi:hypothetical protein